MPTRSTIIAMLVVGSLLTGGIATASTGDGTTTEGPVTEDTIVGAGHLWAVGTGTAVLDGRGTVVMAVSGDVVVTDHAGDVRVFIVADPGDGPEKALPADGQIVLEDFRGRIRVVGSDFTMKAAGSMAFHAHGKGHVSLDGHGIYRNRAGWGTWGGDAATAGIGFGDA
jgi:hypothetical protein